VQEVVDQIKTDFGSIDYLVHSLANGPEVTKPLLETSRAGYLAASSASAYSLVSMVSRFAPIMKPGNIHTYIHIYIYTCNLPLFMCNFNFIETN
jgi:enoyl-[acyl-carrier protein] reductase I